MTPTIAAMDGNEAAAYVAHRTNEVIAIYPITPSSPMGEHADAWSSEGICNIWGGVPSVTEMQSEGGAAGAVHGALQAGALTTTFTASQGLLLMIPNMYKIAGELLPTVFHVAARTVATHALSIFCDHSDVMAARQTGFAMLASSSVQEVMDFALIAQAATLKSRIPFLHFFDGFRTSHEIARIEVLSDPVIRGMIDEAWVRNHKLRAMSPDHPSLRGTSQNPDVFFQCREACNPFYAEGPGIVREMMDRFAKLTGRKYGLFDYSGHPEAERVIVAMGSGAETAGETTRFLAGRGEKVGVVRVRLYRPFDVKGFVECLPPTTGRIAVLDRTKEPGGVGEPLYLDVMAALAEGVAEHPGRFQKFPRVTGGRYGLSSKEFTPSMVKAVFDELGKDRPKNHFTVGIRDDVTHTSLDFDPEFSLEQDGVVRAMFFGLGADGTVGANKNSIKIIAEETPNFAQGYFVYDSRKAGSVTISHLRFGPRPISASYLIESANFIGCHQFNFLDRIEMLDKAAPGATFLLNSPYSAEEVWDHLPCEVQKPIREKGLKFYVIDAYGVAREAGMGQRINTIMQTCFFSISGVLPREEAMASIKKSIEKTYGSKGREVVEKNFQVVDRAVANLHPVEVPVGVGWRGRPAPVPDIAPDFVRRVTAIMLAGQGDQLPVSAFPPDGTWPTGTARWEKRNIALEIPIWDSGVCIQCNKCALVCPHAAIRVKVFDSPAPGAAPDSFLPVDYKGPEYAGKQYAVQVAPEDCTGCGVCVDVCPAKNKSVPRLKAINMLPHAEHVDRERVNYEFFLGLPDPDRESVHVDSVKGPQFMVPLFEYSGACSGCGETPYLKLLSQLFGDRLLIANATGCSSIYGGNLPTTPWTTNAEGRGPAWANSLFEDNAEFGLGFRLAVDRHQDQARRLLTALEPEFGSGRVRQILEAPQATEEDIKIQRNRVADLKEHLKTSRQAEAERLVPLADYLVDKSVWIVGGDGWAYDIGFGGLDHVLWSGKNVNILVLDTMVYSNTGGQMSKSTPLGAVAKFAADGKGVPRKNLGQMVMAYGHCYVAQVALGARDIQTVKAFLEAERYPGPSIIIAYSQCIAHGINMTIGMQHQKAAVESGFWPLYRYNPMNLAKGENPLHLDSKSPQKKLRDFMNMETRFRVLGFMDPDRQSELLEAAEAESAQYWDYLEKLAGLDFSNQVAGGTPQSKSE
ncbi:MAG: pyruvate:ferredoxin (flavodoxin) oxidoreductase [Nitrospinae bacterium CG11_big_fil_rev_8_21_14_0_20_56_8]|nr:MAG: pyruvate:ferredoxin (flavodoxin) oxidoreductase [Nitrospinae bacterium CG11_big_fil_rev_8_21_14_0_20_56_8]